MKKSSLATAVVAGIVCAFLVGCTDAELGMLGAYGDAATITCYSGGQVVFEDQSTGKVSQIDGDGIQYVSKHTGRYVRAYADCIVEV